MVWWSTPPIAVTIPAEHARVAGAAIGPNERRRHLRLTRTPSSAVGAENLNLFSGGDGGEGRARAGVSGRVRRVRGRGCGDLRSRLLDVIVVAVGMVVFVGMSHVLVRMSVEMVRSQRQGNTERRHQHRHELYRLDRIGEHDPGDNRSEEWGSSEDQLAPRRAKLLCAAHPQVIDAP